MPRLTSPGVFLRVLSENPKLKLESAWLAFGVLVLPGAFLMSLGVSEEYVLPLLLICIVPIQYAAFCLLERRYGNQERQAQGDLLDASQSLLPQAQLVLKMAIKPQVGEMARQVWQLLSNDGPHTLAQLQKKLKPEGDVLSFALGWLAREDKIDFVPEKKTFRVQVKQ